MNFCTPADANNLPSLENWNIPETKKYRNKLYTSYLMQQANAARREIEWGLTFKEWILFWAASGVLHLRGRGYGKYVMGRFGDKGPYKIGNIKILLNSANVREAQLGISENEVSRQKNREGQLGRTHSKQTRLKMSLAQRGVPKSEQHCLNISKALQGRTISEAHRKLISQANLGKTMSAEARRKISIGNTGKVRSLETRLKISASKKGTIPSAKTRLKISRAGIGRIHSLETRAKMSAARHKFWDLKHLERLRSKER